jgi:hypothetical protein
VLGAVTDATAVEREEPGRGFGVGLRQAAKTAAATVKAPRATRVECMVEVLLGSDQVRTRSSAVGNGNVP